jgi:electron transfer flavoprotein alpha subunit
MSVNALILAAHESQQLDPGTACLVTAARKADACVHVLVLGDGSIAVAEQAARLAGVSQVLLADAPQLANPNAETVARQLHSLIDGYPWILASHQMLARAALPRAAALANAAYLADVSDILSADRLVRPMYAGSVNATVQPTVARCLFTVRTSAFEACGESSPCAITRVSAAHADDRTRSIGLDAAPDTRPDLARARVVVAGGRGVGAAQHMRLVEALADRLGAAVGASRAAVDAGFAPNAWQIGQTGKTVAPELYFAFGISGAIQHLAGIKDAGVIVAVNKDPDAPIFGVADIGLVGDLFEVLPRLSAELPVL